MASFKIALILFTCLEVCAPTTDGLQNVPEKAKGDVCKDCTQIFELLADLISNDDLQKKLIAVLDNLCGHLPGGPAKICKEEVEKMLPMAVNFLTAIVKPADVCKVFGLCASCDSEKEKKLQYLFKELFQVLETNENAQPTTQCSFCILLVKTLEDLLPKERTEDAVLELLEEICQVFPSSYRDQCEAVIGKFGKTVIDAVLSFTTPQAICALIHMCKGQEAPVVDPCTLTAYRCRDIKTAVKCGTLFYCQKFAWKPISSNTL